MFPFHIATPQNCNIQTFYGAASTTPTKSRATWNKPVGVSHVYMLLIGGGGNGDGGTTGGGSGAVTVFYCAAQHVPNSLFIWVGPAQSPSYISIDQIGNFGFLTANGATTSTTGNATTAPALAASGFYKSTAGQNGSVGSVIASSTTFLSAGGVSGATISNYGYQGSSSGGTRGYFLMQPIIVGVGGSGANRGGVGCGGGATGTGGPGMVLIASW